MPSLSVIVPCYNEEGTLEVFIPTVSAEALRFSRFEILVVDDASRDRSPQILEALARRFPLRVIRNDVNLGLGGAMRRGFDSATGDWLTYLPADGQVPAEELRKFLPYMELYDLIIGRRTSPVDYSAYRRLASRVYNTWAALAFGLRISDFNWMQAWRRSLWSRYGSKSNSVFICGEFLVRSQPSRPRMVEIEIAYRPRLHGQTTYGNPKAALKAAQDITRVFIEEARAGRFPFLHPVSPDRSPSAPVPDVNRRAG